jgi:segregation and condensation protein A
VPVAVVDPISEPEPASIPTAEPVPVPVAQPLTVELPVAKVEAAVQAEAAHEPEEVNEETVNEPVPPAFVPQAAEAEPVLTAEPDTEAALEPVEVSEPVVEPELAPDLAPAAQHPDPGTETPAETLPESSGAAEPELPSQAVAEQEPALVAEPEIVTESPASDLPRAGIAQKVETAGETAAKPEELPEAEPVLEAEPAPEAVPLAQAEPVPAPVPTAAFDAANPLALPPPSAADQKADEKAAAKLAARQKMLDESSEQSPFSVFVGQVYDGPLDLLLDLIRKQDIDIYDIPIARITAQFLAYVNQLKATDVDVAGEFIYTASLLIHIKSKMLLPRAASGPEDAAEDPRRELVERLLEHERFKSAAQMLQQKQMLEAATWSNPGSREFKDDAAAEPEIAADTVDLVRIFRDILERARKRPVLDVTEDSVTVGQMIQFLARRLTMEDKPVALHRLLSHTRSERALIAMFLALLELVRLQAILLRQDRAFSEIFIKKHTGFETVMNDGLANAHDEWR